MQLDQAVWHSYMWSVSYSFAVVETAFCCERSTAKKCTPATNAPATDRHIMNKASRASGDGFLNIFHTPDTMQWFHG